MDRLSALDASLLYLEDDGVPLTVGGVAIFQPPASGFDHERLVALVSARLAYVPRYRQKVRHVPGGVARPVWVDDPDFDITFHVRRSAVPSPGSREQLAELVARLMSRPLDRSRPLWEMYLIEGLADGTFAVVTKSHEALVDGLASMDIAQVMLDPSPEGVSREELDDWHPEPEPSDAQLLFSSVSDALSGPGAAWDFTSTAVRDVVSLGRGVAERGISTAGTVLSMAARTATGFFRTPDRTPLKARVGSQRRFEMISLPLTDFQEVRAATGGSVNDVILTTVTGALRTWMQTRGQNLSSRSTLTAMVPVSVSAQSSVDHSKDRAGLAGDVGAYLVDLPIGEVDPIVRLHQIAFHMRDLQRSEEFLGARAIVNVAGFGPPTLHALGARVGATLARRSYSVSVTNVPGPQRALYVAGAQMLEAYPVTPVAHGQALSIGATSYLGAVHFGIFADRDVVPDLQVVAQALPEALAELRGAVES